MLQLLGVLLGDDQVIPCDPTAVFWWGNPRNRTRNLTKTERVLQPRSRVNTTVCSRNIRKRHVGWWVGDVRLGEGCSHIAEQGVANRIPRPADGLQLSKTSRGTCCEFIRANRIRNRYRPPGFSPSRSCCVLFDSSRNVNAKAPAGPSAVSISYPRTGTSLAGLW